MKSRQRKWAVLLCVMLSSLALSGCKQTSEEKTVEDVAVVETKKPQVGDLKLSGKFIATISPDESVYVIPKATAEVLEVRVSAGDVVEEGDVLAVLDDTMAQFSVRNAETAAQNAQIGLESAKLSYELQYGEGASTLNDMQSDKTISQAEDGVSKLQENYVDAMDNLEKAKDEIEKELGIATCPVNWPIGSGKRFKGVYNRHGNHVLTFSDTQKGTREGETTVIPMDNETLLLEKIGDEALSILRDEIELLDGASAEFDIEQVRKGKLTPVFFGSALTNFGVEVFLQNFLKMATTPLPRISQGETIDPVENDFSAFVFKIQANMNKAHRDRVAFMRICSGKFDAGVEVRHVQGGKVMRLSQPQQIMADERKILSEAYAGDIIGVFDPGIFSIGDTVCAPKNDICYEGIPTFAPEHFARVRQMDTMKRKQFIKGVNQIAQEGAIQIFQEFHTGMEEIIVGVVGVLQFDVLKYRLENEYNVEIKLEPLPYEYIRWIENKDEVDLNKLSGTSDMKKIQDLKGNPLLLFINQWSIGMTVDRNKGLVLSEFGRN